MWLTLPPLKKNLIQKKLLIGLKGKAKPTDFIISKFVFVMAMESGVIY